MSLAAALRAQARVLDALAAEAEARERDAAASSAGDPLLRDRDIAADLAVGVSDACRLRRAGHFGSVIYLGPRRPRVRRSQVERFKETAANKRIA